MLRAGFRGCSTPDKGYTLNSFDITSDIISTAADAVGILMIVPATIWALIQWRHSLRLKGLDTYLTLEFQSISLFQFEAEHADVLSIYEKNNKPDNYVPDDANEVLATSFFFQTLNLFELAGRFQRQGLMTDDIYCTWVAWFYEVLGYWYFREIWEDDLRLHYKTELQSIFNKPVKFYHDEYAGEGKYNFYKHVSEVTGSRAVLDHLSETQNMSREINSNVTVSGK